MPAPASTTPFPAIPRPLTAAVVTVSDGCARGQREDASGPAVIALLSAEGFTVPCHLTVADEQPAIEDALHRAAATAALVVTTGGTGLTLRDVTPEATQAVCTRLLDGLSEQMRREGLKETPFAVLSRGVCGLMGKTLVVNLPGSPRGAVTSLRALLPVLPHALGLVADPTDPHPDANPDVKRDVQEPAQQPATGSPA